MIFPITDLLDEQESIEWMKKYFHPNGLRCPGCDATPVQARLFRTRKRGLVDYRCQLCQQVYNLYTRTIFAGSNLDPRRVVLLLRGICKGEPSTVIAQELSLSRLCVHRWRKRIQANAFAMLSQAALTDADKETDEMFQNAGKKAKSTAIRLIRRVGEPTNDAVMATMKMTGHRWWVQLAGKVGNAACAYASVRMARP